MAVAPLPYISRKEYERLEAVSVVKRERHDGQIVAMSGGSLSHGRLIVRLLELIGTQLRGTIYEPFGAGIRVLADQMIAYPDALVVSGRVEIDPLVEAATVLNPSVIFEVLSPSTERLDRGFKLRRYRTIPTVTDCVLISQDEAVVECFHRLDEEHWVLTTVTGLEAVFSLPEYGLELPLSELYERVEFPTEPASPFAPLPEG